MFSSIVSPGDGGAKRVEVLFLCFALRVSDSTEVSFWPGSIPPFAKVKKPSSIPRDTGVESLSRFVFSGALASNLAFLVTRTADLDPSLTV